MAKSAGRPQSAKPAASSGPSRGRDILHVILIGVVAAALFTAIAIGGSYAIGVKPAATPIGGQSNSGGTQAAVVPTNAPTAIPTATEIPCEAPAWWGTHREAIAEVVDNITSIAVNTPPGNINAMSEGLKTWSDAFAAEQHPPCVAAATQALTQFSTSAQGYVNAYLTSVTTAQQRGLALLDVLNALQPAANALTDLQLALPEDAWVGKVQNFFTAECPAAKWYAEIIVGKDYYERYATVKRDANLQNPSRETLEQLRDLGSAFRTDSASFPECVQAAAAHFQTSVDSFFNGLNEVLNGNAAAASSQIDNANAELNTFVTDIRALIPAEDTYPAVQPA